MVLKVRYVFALLVLITVSESAKILVTIPTPSISHQAPFKRLIQTLAENGHSMVVWAPIPMEYKTNSSVKITQLDLSGSQKIFNENIDFTQANEQGSEIPMMKNLYEVLVMVANYQLNHKDVRKIIDSNEKFDLCFVEAFFTPMLGVKDHFGCQLILVSSMIGVFNAFESMGNPTHPILYHDQTSTSIQSPSFWDRFFTTYDNLITRYIHYVKFKSAIENSAWNGFGNHIRSVYEIEEYADMMFICAYNILDNIRPIVPGIIYVGGMHIEPTKPLPQDLQELLDGAENGVVYFSLGSNVKSIDLPAAKIEMFIDAFKALPYLIMWKWENDTMPDKPKNVFISKWMPQQDVLAHPNIKAFITQGGQQSLEEAIHYKVPLVGLPFIGDQFLNVQKIAKFGIGIELQYDTRSNETITEAVVEVITNEEFKKNISKLSDLIKDQPQTPLERAVWWTEYVLRHGGASHLKAPAVGVPFYKYFLLDIIAFILGCIIMFLVLVVMIIKCLCRCCCSKKDKTD